MPVAAPPGIRTSTTSSTRPRPWSTWAAAQAPDPHALVSPAPRSQVRSRTADRSTTDTRLTLQPPGLKHDSITGPTDARSTAPGSSTTTTRCGLPKSVLSTACTGNPPRSRSRPSIDGPVPATPISTVASTSRSVADPTRVIRRCPAGVSTTASRPEVPSACLRSSAWPKHRRPFPLTSAGLPSLLNRVNLQSASPEPATGVPNTSPSAPIPSMRSHSRRATSAASAGTSSANVIRKSLPRPWCLVSSTTPVSPTTDP